MGIFGKITAPDVNARVVKPKLGYDEVGGLHDKLRDLSASLMMGGGNDEAANTLLQQLQQRQQAQQEQAYREAQMARLSRPEVLNLGEGGVATFDHNGGGLNVIRQPDPPRATSSTEERLLERWKALPAGHPEKALIERMLPGIQYTAPVMQAQQQGRAALKAMPTYGNLHPRATTRAAPKPPAGFILD